MLLSSWIRGFQQRLLVHRAAKPRRRTSQFGPTVADVEVLEERRLLSGFAPTDGASVVEAWTGNYQAVKIQPGDQKIVAAGTATAPLPGGVAVERYDSQGNADATYHSGGLSNLAGMTMSSGHALALQPDGKAVVAGDAVVAGSRDVGVARLNVNGSLDSGFGTGGFDTFSIQPGADAAYGVGLQSTGKIVVSGSSLNSTLSTAVYSAFVARFTATGAIDSGKGGFGKVVHGNATGDTLTSFGQAGSGSTGSGLGQIAVQPDDMVVAVGGFTPDGVTTELVVARYTAAGALDTTFNGKGYSVFLPAGISSTNGTSVALQSDGRIVVAGYCSGVDGRADMLVARFNSNGTLDTSFGGGAGYVRFDVDGTASVTAEIGNGVVIQTDGKIVVGGYERGSGPSNVLVARFNADGTLDQTFAPGGFKLGAPPAGHSFAGAAVALEADGSIIVAGSDAWTDNSSHPLLMRFFGSSTPAGALRASGSAALAPSDAPQTAIQTLTQPAGNMAFAGPFVSNDGFINPSQPASTAIQVGGAVTPATPVNGGASADDLTGATIDLFDSHGTNLLKGRNRR